jgi:hypothetical protein
MHRDISDGQVILVVICTTVDESSMVPMHRRACATYCGRVIRVCFATARRFPVSELETTCAARDTIWTTPFNAMGGRSDRYVLVAYEATLHCNGC